MYEFKKKKIGKVFTCKSVGTRPSSYEKRIYWAEVSQKLRITGIECKQNLIKHVVSLALVLLRYQHKIFAVAVVFTGATSEHSISRLTL